MSWFILALIAMLALTLADLTQQYILSEVQKVSEKTSTAVTLILTGLFALPMALLGPHSADFSLLFDNKIFFVILINAFVSALATYSYFKALNAKNISLSLIFISMSVVLSTALGIIIFRESTTIVKFIGILLVLVAIVGVKFKNVHLERNNFFGLVSAFFFAIAFTLDKFIVLQVDPMVYIATTCILSGLCLILISPKEVLTDIRQISLTTLKPIMLSASGYLAFNLFTFTAYTVGGEVGKVDAIVVNSEIFLVIVFEYFALKHTEDLKRKFITAAIAAVGIVLLGLYN